MSNTYTVTDIKTGTVVLDHATCNQVMKRLNICQSTVVNAANEERTVRRKWNIKVCPGELEAHKKDMPPGFADAWNAMRRMFGVEVELE